MKILKKTGIALLALVVLILIAAAIMPKHFDYERSTDIKASKEVVFGIVNDLKTQDTWGPWVKSDPTIKNTYNDLVSGVGQVSTWTSENSGTGKQTITESTPPTSVKYKIEFGGSGGGDAWFKLEDGEAGSTKTSWGMGMDMSWPWNFMAVLMGGRMNKMLEDGLVGLKDMAEKKAAEAPAVPAGSFEVKTMDFPGQAYLGLREKTTQAAVMEATFFADRFGKIMTLMEKTKMQQAGSPSGLYYTWDDATKSTDIAVAIPINKGAAVSGGAITSFELPASKAVYVDYYGPYDSFQAAHNAIGEYIKANGLKEKAPVIEQYITDPMTEKDPAKWLTKIIYLIEG